MARLTALQIYRYLPAKNCGKCGEATCMAFAMKLIELERNASDCTELSSDGLERLLDALRPPVRAITIGTGENSVTVGGEEVMYRHEFKFFNPSAIFIDISDRMKDNEIRKRINLVKNFEIERIGQKLRLDGIAVRSASGDSETFRKVIEDVSMDFAGPMALCSFDLDVLTSGISAVSDRKPLLYAANEENWEDVLKIANNYDTPMVIYSPDLSKMGTLVRELSIRNFNNIILDPGIDWGSGLARTLNRFVMLRKSALNGVSEFGYPLMCSTLMLWTNSENKMDSAYNEATMACMMMDRFSSLVVIHSTDIWSLLPVITLRQNIYTDPRVEPAVEAKLYEIGNPDENSPLFITTNFAMTYFSLTGDLENSPIPCYLLVIDTEGLAVTVSVAAGKLTASGIRDALEKYSVEDKVRHNKIIIPGVAARMKGAIEDATGWDVIVGPQDSSQIHNFLRENWKHD